MTQDDDNREYAVEFGALADELEREEYPMSDEDLIDEYGDREIGVKGGSRTLREVLDPLGETTFDTPDGVIRSIVGMVGDDAIGREDYSDRGGSSSGQDREQESL